MRIILLNRLRAEAIEYAHIIPDGDFFILSVGGVHEDFCRRENINNMIEEMQHHRNAFIASKAANLNTRKIEGLKQFLGIKG